MKFLLKFLVCSAILFVFIGIAAPKKFDFGIKVTKKDEPYSYTSVIMKYPFYTNTFVIGEMPVPDEISDIIVHKEKDEYWTLTENEKIVYDAILSRAISIYKEETTNLTVNIPMDNFQYTNFLPELENDLYETVNQLDYTKIFTCLHHDYDWLLWYEKDMSWIIYSPDIFVKDDGIEGTSFMIEIQPLSIYTSENNDLNQMAVQELRASKEELSKINEQVRSSEDKLDTIKNYILSKLSYNNIARDRIISNEHSEDFVYYSSPLSFLAEEKPSVVCQGYANLFQMLCDINNITCYTKTGIISSYQGQERHAWNIVQDDEQSKLVDLTNTDTGSIGHKGELYMRDVEGSTYELNINDSVVKYTEK